MGKEGWIIFSILSGMMVLALGIISGWFIFYERSKDKVPREYRLQSGIQNVNRANYKFQGPFTPFSGSFNTDDCGALCDSIPGCTSFVYQSSPSQCWISNDPAPNSYPNKGYTSGIRK